MKARSTIALTGPERVKLAAHILKSERTIYRVYLGQGSDQSREAVRRGALELGLTPPPEPQTEKAA